jgi:hypothetical protein
LQAGNGLSADIGGESSVIAANVSAFIEEISLLKGLQQ